MCRSLPVCYLDNGSRGFNAPRASSHPHGNVGLWLSVQAAAGLCSSPEEALSGKLLPV